MQTTVRRMSSKIAPARIISQNSHIISGKLRVTEHFFDVPKDYSKPDGGTIRLFARSARKHEVPIAPEPNPKDGSDPSQLPLLCFLQGGPGGSCGPPQSSALTQSILDRGYEIVFLDQRGTGLSTPLTASTLQMRGGNDVQARYLKLFRADSIVRDCEAVRQALTAAYPAHKQKWSILGQSFGGFISLSYLSFHPEGLRESFIFGGLSPISETNPDEVYRRCYRKVAERNHAYYDKYPEDVERVKKILNYLQRFGDGRIKLPSEGALTRRRFLQLGIHFGAHGGLDQVHDLVLSASTEIEAFGHITRVSLAAIEDATRIFDNAILYAILHEPIYCQGEAANWSAARVMSEDPVFDVNKTADDPNTPVFFTGEMVYPWMFEDYSELAKIQDVANRVAADADWPPLYDVAQLARNTVPVYAAAYTDDMFVDIDMSLDTARKVKGCKVFTTNSMFHNAIRAKTDEVLRQMFALRDDVLD